MKKKMPPKVLSVDGISLSADTDEMPSVDNEWGWKQARQAKKGFNQALFIFLGNKVCSGPFEGMLVDAETVWDDGNSGAKLIGCYEMELHFVLAQAMIRAPQTIVNVGCAEGYYAIGFARTLPQAHVYAMDIDGRSLSLLRRNALWNRVAGRITARVGCKSAEELDVGGAGHHLYVLDCEGKEASLLDKNKCPLLKRSDIIVECHDFFNPAKPISKRLADHFMDTHEVYLINQALPQPSLYPFLNVMPFGTRLTAVTELRPAGSTVWLACWSNSR